MNTSSNSPQPEFWDTRYRTRRTACDLGRTPECRAQFPRTHAAKGRALVPRCGSGYEVSAFADAGWEAIAIDFGPAAVERARQVLGPLASRVVLGDFFAHDFGPMRFDLVYERTFLCSLPPSIWESYACRIESLLKPGGLLVGIFFYGEGDEPPPYPLTRELAHALFGGVFELKTDLVLTDSLPVFAGGERWQEWQKRAAVVTPAGFHPTAK